jgi:hypothetical protein
MSCGCGSTAIAWAVSRRWRIVRGRVGPGRFPPEVALHLVRRACELPEQAGRSLSQWDCAELARQLVRAEVVASISPQTVQRLLATNRLKPWRCHGWLHPRTPRDATFATEVRAVADLLTRLLDEHEVVLSLDEMTSLQPRPRRVATRPARSGRPVQVEHEYRRAGATHLFAAFDTRSDGSTGSPPGASARSSTSPSWSTSTGPSPPRSPPSTCSPTTSRSITASSCNAGRTTIPASSPISPRSTAPG